MFAAAVLHEVLPITHGRRFALDGRFTGREHDIDYQIDADFYVAMNAWQEPLKFRIPTSPTRRRWRGAMPGTSPR